MSEDTGTFMTPAWGLLIGLVSGAIVLAFYLSGHFEIGKFAGFSAAAIMVAVRIEWEYRGKKWFWMLISAVVAVHVAILVAIKVSAESYPALIFSPVFIVDIFLVVWLIEIVHKINDPGDA